ncbi:MAG: hypothetical protein WA323_20765 [Candidatus Nitrosopolaris sp.]
MSSGMRLDHLIRECRNNTHNFGVISGYPSRDDFYMKYRNVDAILLLPLLVSQRCWIENKETEMLAGENDLAIDPPAASCEVQQLISL